MEKNKILSYLVVYEGGQGEIVEKKSRFIATIKPVETEEEAVIFINEMKKKYWDAKHNCSAFVIGKSQEMNRCSDDGEPAQTAGRPMLDVLLKEGITNVAVVVTRYFGGVLLGTGGLVRAYQKAVQEGLKNSVIINKQNGFLLNIKTDYTGLGKLQYLFAQNEISTLHTEYGQDVEIKVLVPMHRKTEIEKAIIEQSSGTAVLNWGEEVIYAVIKNEIKLF